MLTLPNYIEDTPGSNVLVYPGAKNMKKETNRQNYKQIRYRTTNSDSVQPNINKWVLWLW